METQQQIQHSKWKEARARIEAAALSRSPEPKADTPAQTNNARILHIIPPSSDINADMMDMIVAAVGVATEVPVNEIISGPPLPENISARKLAMALCVRLPRIDVTRVVDRFEVSEEAVRDALSLLDPILREYAITAKTPLHLSIPLIAKIWSGKVEEARRVPTIREIQSAVCQVWRITHNDLISSCRQDTLVEPRHIAMALCRRLTPKSLPEIGRHFGHRDHTTVLHAVKKCDAVMGAVAERMSPMCTPYAWALAAHAQTAITPIKQGRA